MIILKIIVYAKRKQYVVYNLNVLNSSPEKCYEGSKLTSRVGMPVSELLPESNTGSVISNHIYPMQI